MQAPSVPVSMSSIPLSSRSPSSHGLSEVHSDLGGASFMLDADTSQLEQLLLQNDQLARENDMFMSFLRKYDEKLAAMEFEEPPKARRGKKKMTTKQVMVSLSTAHKIDVVSRELDAARLEISRANREGEKKLDDLDAAIEHAEVQVEEIKKEAKKFKHDVILGGQLPSGAIAAEKVIHYLEETLKAKNALAAQLHLKNDVLIGQIRRTRQTLKEKDEVMGDSGLGQIDYDQLRIENKQYFEKIQEKNEELLKLKLAAGSLTQSVNEFKHELQHIVKENEWLHKEIAQRQDFLKKLSDQAAVVRSDLQSQKEVHDELSGKMSNTRVPDIMDYVKQTDRERELLKVMTDLQRKLDIAEAQMRRLISASRRTGTNEPLTRTGSSFRGMSRFSSRGSMSHMPEP